MPFCPRCGASTTPTMLYCAACGESLASVARPPTPQAPAAAPAATFPPMPAPPVARGPPGQPRETWLVLVLSIVTFGLYGLYYWWVSSRELDEYLQRPGHSHNLIRIGTIVSIVAGVALFFAIVAFAVNIYAEAIDGVEPTPEEVLRIVFGAIGFFLLGGAGLLVGAILRLVGEYRMWEGIEADERRRQHATPLSAGLLLALTLVGWFFSPFGWVLSLIALYMTQEHLNQMWAAARA